jgi:hypothetical protein
MNPESMLKGRMAESLVEELLRKCGNQVYRFGYEAILQNLTQIQKSFEAHGETSDRIRAIPDFIVIDKTGKPIFLEVKFRGDGKLHDNDKDRLNRIKDFWNAKIIFVNRVNKPYFKISNPPYIGANGDVECKPLIEETEWGIDANSYDEFEKLVEKYLALKLVEK